MVSAIRPITELHMVPCNFKIRPGHFRPHRSKFDHDVIHENENMVSLTGNSIQNLEDRTERCAGQLLKAGRGRRRPVVSYGKRRGVDDYPTQPFPALRVPHASSQTSPKAGRTLFSSFPSLPGTGQSVNIVL